MLRTPIEGLVLQVKAMQQKAAGGVLGGGKGDGLRVLRRCPDPPQEASIAAAVAYLSQIQALAPNAGGGLLVTPLGAHLSSLPCSPAAGKLLLFGCILGSAFRCSAMVACMGARSPFLSPSDPAVVVAHISTAIYPPHLDTNNATSNSPGKPLPALSPHSPPRAPAVTTWRKPPL